ncbi:MAG: transcription/translation regulatory transformer protein RfaH [Parahaliea sp.]
MKLWYAVQTKARRENVAEQNLQRQGFTVYLPRICQKKRLRGKWMPVVEPLFPRYIFIHVDAAAQSLAPVRSTLGVQQLVRFGSHLHPVPEPVIEYLRAEETSDTRLEQAAHWPHRPGDTVEILEGPFAGLTGVFKMPVAEDRAVLLVRLLGRDNEIALYMHSLAKPLLPPERRTFRSA